MHRSIRRGLLACASACICLVPTAVLAAQQAETPAPAPTLAPAAVGDQGAGLNEIIVTAQFRSQNLQDTPIAITAISGDDLAARSLTNVTQLSSIAPNVQLRPAGAEHGPATQALIRGVGQSDSSFAFEPAVGMYVDDVYYATLLGSQLDLLDVDRIEVLRGPQGTLFGKNSLGGAVRIITSKPRGDNSGFIEAGYGSYDRVMVRGAYDVSLVQDVLALRVSGAADRRDGYQKILDFACAHPDQAGSLPTAISGPAGSQSSCKLGTYGGMDSTSVRGHLRFTPNDRLEANLAVDYTRDDSEAPPVSVTTIDPTAPALAAFNQNVNVPLYGVGIDQRFQSTDPFVTYATNTDPTLGYQQTRNAPVKTWGTTLTLDYELSPDMSLKSITAYRKTDSEFSTDNDGSPLQIQNLTYLVNADQYSQELRLTGSAVDDHMHYTVGGYYFVAHQHQQGGVENSLFGLVFGQNDRFRTRNYSAYLNVDFDVTDSLSVIGGLRYSNERKSFAFDHEGFLVVTEPAIAQYDHLDYRVAANYKLTDNVSLYGSIATGFRSGGFNPRPFNATQLTSFGPEKLTAYELGVKTELFDKHARINIAAFNSDYTDRIVTVSGIDALGDPFQMPRNIGSATIKGFEGEIQASPVAGLRLNGSVGYAKFTSPELQGLKQVGVPDWTADAGIEYHLPLGDDGSLTPRFDWYYQSRVNYQLDNDPRAQTPPRSIFNASLTWQVNSDLQASFKVTNLFNKRYDVQKFTYLDIGYGIVNAQPGRPREWMLSLRHKL